MKTPDRGTYEEYRASCLAYENGCPKCGAAASMILAYVSVHSIWFAGRCVGEGKVDRLIIPYCPQCEQMPDKSGCIHV